MDLLAPFRPRTVYARDMDRVLLVGAAVLLCLIPDALGWYHFPRGLFVVLFLALCVGMIFCNGRLLYQTIRYGKGQEV